MKYDDQVSILIKASDIPDRATVTKKTGTHPLTISHGLTVYSDTKGEKPLKIDGVFLLGDRGSITQIKPDTLLAMHMSAGDLHDWLEGNVEDLDPDWNK